MTEKLVFKEGGNPPVNSGLFIQHDGMRDQRIAFLPPGVGQRLSEQDATRIEAEFWRTGEIVGRTRVREIIGDEPIT